MSVTLDLPEELESELAMEAARLGLPLPGYILRLISTPRLTGNKPETGAELVEYWQTEGLIGARPDIADSQTHARGLRERAERRRQASSCACSTPMSSTTFNAGTLRRLSGSLL